MNLEQLKELYINNSENIDKETMWFCKDMFSKRMNPNFGPIGINYLYELIKLLGYTKKYDKINIEDIENLIDNEAEILEMLKNTNNNEYSRIKELFNANNYVKEKTYECIKENLLQYRLEQWRNKLNSNNTNTNIEYSELTKNSFKNNDGRYVAENVLFCNLKIEEVNLYGDLDAGYETIMKVKQLYGNQDLKKMCVKGIVEDCSDWDDRITTEDEVSNFLTGTVLLMDICNGELGLWFNTTEDDLFGGHNPKLCFVPDKNYICVGME